MIIKCLESWWEIVETCTVDQIESCRHFLGYTMEYRDLNSAILSYFCFSYVISSFGTIRSTTRIAEYIVGKFPITFWLEQKVSDKLSYYNVIKWIERLWEIFETCTVDQIESFSHFLGNTMEYMELNSAILSYYFFTM